MWVRFSPLPLNNNNMDYKQFIIGMILSMSKNHKKEQLYTMSLQDLVYLKDQLLDKIDGYLKVSNKNYIN